MARKRSLPTSLFASPDFFELSSNTTRLIFIGLILDADDEGRGLAHTQLLARKLDQQPEEIEQALEELAAHGMLCCYEGASRRFYWLCHWHNYQILSKPTPSLYPAPPEQAAEQQEQQDSGKDEPVPPLLANHRKEKEAEKPSDAPPQSEERYRPPTSQVASLLHLPEDAELEAIVQEFAGTSTLSVLGEAIEARAWIEDRRRNTRQQPMTLAFFRRWLRRSQSGAERLATLPRPEASDTSTLVTSPASEPDQYEIYVKVLQAKYSDPAALQKVR